MNELVKILCVGDVIGSPGLILFSKHISALKKEFSIDATIVNGENSAVNGRGITSLAANELLRSGADFITGGNHSFDQREVYETLSNLDFPLLRPANFPAGCPGRGVGFVSLPNGHKIGVINLQGRIFSRQQLECPFKALDSILTFVRSQTNIIIVDFHAEATSEKAGFAYFADGRVSAIFGTHTHVQTADERILPNGTGFITDIGMIGALNSMIGMKKDPIIHNMRTQLPVKFEVDTEPPFVISGIVFTIEKTSGKTVAIERIFKTYQQ